MAGKKIDINKAGIEELSSLIGVGRARAEAIMEARKALGGFKSTKDLTSIPGIGPSILEMNHGLLSCGKPLKESVQSSLSVSEVYCLRDRGDAATSTSPNVTQTDSYRLRDRGDSSKPNRASPQKPELPSSSQNHRLSGGDNKGVISCVRIEQEEDDDNEIQFRNDNVQCEVFGDSDSDSSQEQTAERSPDCSANLSSADMGNSSDGESVESGDVYSLVEDSGMAGSLRARSAHTPTDKSVMKRKSEGGGSKDGSPEKKPCRSSSEGVKSEGQSVSPAAGNSSSKSGDKSTHPFLRKGRIPSKANPPPELANWLKTFVRWSHAERLMALDELMEQCEATQVRHVMQVIEPQFQRDFISLLPKELALYVLSYLGPLDLCRAAQTCQYWRVLAEDNLLWREKCQEESIDERFVTESRQRGGGAGGKRFSACKSPWKAAFMRQQHIEYNWREAKIRPPKVLKGHDDHVITCLEFSGSKVVSGSDDNTLKVWSAITGKCLRTLVGHTGGVWSSQMRDNIIISGSTDRTLKVWNADTGQCVHTLYGHTSTVRCMCLHGNKVVSGSRDATLRLWDVDTGQCLHVLMGHVAAVRCVQYDGRRVVSGAYDYMVKVWDPDTESCLHTLSGHTNRVYSLQFDGAHIVSGSLDTSIRVWEVETGQCLHTLIGHQSLTSGMELKDNILVSGNADSTVKVWDIKTGFCLQTLQGVFKHQSAVTCLQFNKKFVITSSDDGTVKMWSLRTGCFLRNLVSLDSGGSGGVVWRIRASNTKLVCAVGSRNGTEETKLLVLDFDIEDGEGQQSKASSSITASPTAT